MKYIYLVLAFLGYLIPNVLYFMASNEAGDVSFSTAFGSTYQYITADKPTTALIIDLLLTGGAFFGWSYAESRRLGMKYVWVYWIAALVLGLAGAFPTFLYLRERKMQQSQA